MNSSEMSVKLYRYDVTTQEILLCEDLNSSIVRHLYVTITQAH